MFVEMLAQGAEVHVITTALAAEVGTWEVDGVILGTTEGGLLLEQDMTYLRNQRIKRTRQVFRSSTVTVQVVIALSLSAHAGSVAKQPRPRAHVPR